MKRLVMKLQGYLITLLMVATPIVGVANGQNDIEETIAARLALMKPVAHSKWVTGRAIEDTDREKVVIEQAVISGLQYGITTDSTTTFFEAQIEAAKAIQRYWFNIWQDEPPKGLAPDLTATIRPQLLELGDQILSQLGLIIDLSRSPAFRKPPKLKDYPWRISRRSFKHLWESSATHQGGSKYKRVEFCGSALRSTMHLLAT